MKWNKYISAFFHIFFMLYIYSQGVAQISSVNQTIRSVVHIQTDDGTCNGILLNNTKEDGKAYILSAAHCLLDNNRFLSVIAGRDYVTDNNAIKSITWTSTAVSQLKFSRDLDYVFLQLNEEIPSYMLPFYAGWNAEPVLPIAAYGIHSPWTEKILIEELNRPRYATFTAVDILGGVPVENATLNVESWEIGFTEPGSSGSPLFNQWSQLAGILSGGASSIESPFNDFYTRFDLIYEDGVKDWLNTENNSNLTMNGFDFQAETNQLSKKNNFNGKEPFQEITNEETIAEYFINKENIKIKGIYLPLNEVVFTDLIKVSVISGENTLHSEEFFSGALKDFEENYLEFNEEIQLNDDFQIEISHNNSLTFSIHQSTSGAISRNGITEMESTILISALTFNDKPENTIEDERKLVYPNPSNENFFIPNGNKIDLNSLKLYTSNGKLITPLLTVDFQNRLVIHLGSYKKGVYIVNFISNENIVNEKIILK